MLKDILVKDIMVDVNVVDKVEDLARDRVKELFGAEHANVQPHSGSQANMAVYFAVLNQEIQY